MMGRKRKKERKYIPRKQLKFWLNIGVATDDWLLEIISYWKTRREFTEMIKNGLRLMWSLGQGKLDVLFELFPQLDAQLAARYNPAPDPDELKDTIRLVVEASVKKAILENPSLPSGPLVGAPLKQSGEGIGTLANRKIELPLLDDDDDGDTIVLNKAVGSNNKAAMAAMLKIAF